MPITTVLLEFLLSLLRDPAAAAEFRADPEAALESAGLSNVTSEDVDACMPVVLDYAPVIGDREYNAGGNQTSGSTPDGGWHDDDVDADHDHGEHHHDDDDHGHAVQQLMHVVNNYSYNDTITDLSVNQNIWASGDVTQLFDNDAIIASGAGAVAA
ncbi:MAG: IniB N-terminal domain-containing protein, partial [Mycetocola sp.]